MAATGSGNSRNPNLCASCSSLEDSLEPDPSIWEGMTPRPSEPEEVDLEVPSAVAEKMVVS